MELLWGRGKRYFPVSPVHSRSFLIFRLRTGSDGPEKHSVESTDNLVGETGPNWGEVVSHGGWAVKK